MYEGVLILGGTSEARALASLLVNRGVPTVSSLAGRVAEPTLPAGAVRVGGFGGPAGLAALLRAEGVRVLVDATHPFAERISTNAVAAAERAGIPLLRVQRPGWQPAEGVEWHWADTLERAAARVPELGRRAFLTTGRQGLAAFAELPDVWFLIRCVDPPDPADLPPRHQVLLARGPYTADGELELMRRHDVDVLVTKDSGGSMTAAKLEAAGRLGVPVIVVRRPARPAAETVTTADEAADWVLQQLEDA